MQTRPVNWIGLLIFLAFACKKQPLGPSLEIASSPSALQHFYQAELHGRRLSPEQSPALRWDRVIKGAGEIYHIPVVLADPQLPRTVLTIDYDHWQIFYQAFVGDHVLIYDVEGKPFAVLWPATGRVDYYALEESAINLNRSAQPGVGPGNTLFAEPVGFMGPSFPPSSIATTGGGPTYLGTNCCHEVVISASGPSSIVSGGDWGSGGSYPGREPYPDRPGGGGGSGGSTAVTITQPPPPPVLKLGDPVPNPIYAPTVNKYGHVNKKGGEFGYTRYARVNVPKLHKGVDLQNPVGGASCIA